MKLDPARYEHGTRARYVAGCRCAECRASNVRYYHDRMTQRRELAPTVQPSGPAIPGTMQRGGRMVAVLRCPGANGASCVVEGGAWLRGGAVCARCLDRATSGHVPPGRARGHLLALRAAGVGYKTVAAASDIAPSTLGGILADDRWIRAETERRILAVDASTIADHALVDGAATRAVFARLIARGFTKEHLASLLGSSSRALQRGRSELVLAITEARALRLERRALAGEVVPQRAIVEADAERAWIATMLDRGVSAKHLSERLGFVVQRDDLGRRMWPDNRDAVRRLQAELREEADHGLPEGWMLANDFATAGLGYTKDFSVIARKGRAAPPKKRPKARAPKLSGAERVRRRREAMGAEAVREQNRRHQAAKRARDREARANVGAAEARAA